MKFPFLIILTTLWIQNCFSMEETERMRKVVHHQTTFVSKMEQTPQKLKPNSICDCYNATDLTSTEVECR